jgi:hypothetical protein
MTASAAEFGQCLVDECLKQDVSTVLLKVQQYKERMRDPSVGADYVTWITEPVNLTLVHKALIDKLSVPPRLLAIRRASMSRTTKAVLLMTAIELAIKKVHQI